MPEYEKAKEIKHGIINEYYTQTYQRFLYEGCLLKTGIQYFEKSLENYWTVKVPNNVLELGGGSGQHLKFLKYIPVESYVSLDIESPFTFELIEKNSSEFLSKFRSTIGNAQEIPFESSTFDRVFSTCLLHHVDDVLQVLLEARRVTSTGGEIAFLLPTDPGLLNRLIKKCISYPKLRRISKTNPQLLYALEHKNHVGSILELIKFVFQNDSLKLYYHPFGIKSWNLNLFIVAKIVKSSSTHLKNTVQ